MLTLNTQIEGTNTPTSTMNRNTSWCKGREEKGEGRGGEDREERVGSKGHENCET